MKAVLISSLIALLALGASAQAADEPWPERIVGIESMRLATPPPRIETWVRGDAKPGKSTVALEVHVDAEGRVVRMRVHQSSGMGRVDDAAMDMVRKMRFHPYRVDGVAVPVTLALPITVPFRDRM